MIIIQRQRILVVFGLWAIGLSPFLFLLFPLLPIDLELVPLVIAVETMIYVLFAMIADPRSELTSVLLLAAGLTLLRAALNLAGALTLSLSPRWDEGLGQAWMTLSVCNPLSILLQMLLLLTLAPHLFHRYLPRLLTPEEAAAIDEGAPGAEPAERSTLSAPAGGFMEVYTYPQLANSLRKIRGLEGFLLYSDEGLVIWSSFEAGVDAEAASVESNRFLTHMQAWADRLRLRGVEKTLMETPERFVFNVRINRGVRLLAYFTSAVPIQDIQIRIDRVCRTVGEFLRSRHGAGMDSPMFPMERQDGEPCSKRWSS